MPITSSAGIIRSVFKLIKNFIFESARVRESDFVEAEYIEGEESWPLIDFVKVIETYKADR